MRLSEGTERGLSIRGKEKKDKKAKGSQFTSAAFTRALADAGIAISMDGRGRWMDNVVFIERLWRSLGDEDVYLCYADGRERRAASPSGSLSATIDARHQALADRMPMAVWARRRSSAPSCGHDGQRLRVAHMPTAATADAASCCVIERNLERSRFQLRTCLRRSRCAGPVQYGVKTHT